MQLKRNLFQEMTQITDVKTTNYSWFLVLRMESQKYGVRMTQRKAKWMADDIQIGTKLASPYMYTAHCTEQMELPRVCGTKKLHQIIF